MCHRQNKCIFEELSVLWLIYFHRCGFRSRFLSHSCTRQLRWESETDSGQCEKFHILQYWFAVRIGIQIRIRIRQCKSAISDTEPFWSRSVFESFLWLLPDTVYLSPRRSAGPAPGEARLCQEWRRSSPQLCYRQQALVIHRWLYPKESIDSQ